MNGELDFTASLKARVSLLKGVPADVFDKLQNIVTISPGARELCKALKALGYKMAVLSGGFQPLADWLAKELGIRRILCYGDSDLVVQHSSGDWDAKDANMASYRFLVQQLSGYLEGCEFLHVPRNDNEQVDALA